ncbi:MAG: HlyC/CorC family transporter [Parvibaculales bacterium]
MSMSLLYLALFIFFLILISGFFSGSETALTATSRARIHRLQEEGDRRAKSVTFLLLQKERLISAILLGNNLVNILASALATQLFLTMFGEAGVIYATMVMTVIVVIFAEVLPKTYAIMNPDKVALRVATALRLVVLVFSPFTWGLGRITTGFMRLVGVDRSNGDALVPAHEEIRGAIDLHHQEEGVTKGDRDMLGGILDLKDLTVGEVMVHRKNMQMIDIDRPQEEIINAVLDSPYTRIPLWQEDPENIVGVLHAKNVLRALAQTQKTGSSMDIPSLMSSPWFVPETTDLGDQLTAFRARKQHFSLVIDEYGALMGLITLEDILEEIVGQIEDEHDEPDAVFEAAEDGSLVVDGDITIRDLNRETGWALPDEEAITIAGLVIHEARTIPRPGQVFMFHGLRFKILERTRNQIKRLSVTPEQD